MQPSVRKKEHLFSQFWCHFRQNKIAMLSLAYVLCMVVLSIFVPLLASDQAMQMNVMEQNEMPSWRHWFGTDQFGRDLFVRIFMGVRISLFIGWMSALVNGIIGVFYGSIAGLSDGWLGLCMMRIADIIHSIPSMIYLILVTLFLGATQGTMVIGMCVSGWVVMARMVRSEVIQIKNLPFAQLPRALGGSMTRLFFRTILINMLETIVVQMTAMIPQAIFMESMLSFIGIGLSPPQASLGVMAQEARVQFTLYPIQLLYPFVAMGLLIMALNFISDGFMEAVSLVYEK